MGRRGGVIGFSLPSSSPSAPAAASSSSNPIPSALRKGSIKPSSFNRKQSVKPSMAMMDGGGSVGLGLSPNASFGYGGIGTEAASTREEEGLETAMQSDVDEETAISLLAKTALKRLTGFTRMSSAAIALRIRKFFVHEAAAADARRAIIVRCSAGEDSGVGAVHTAAGVGADLCGVDLCGADAGRARRGAERCVPAPSPRCFARARGRCPSL